jgi:hypothetical protein
MHCRESAAPPGDKCDELQKSGAERRNRGMTLERRGESTNVSFARNKLKEFFDYLQEKPKVLLGRTVM